MTVTQLPMPPVPLADPAALFAYPPFEALAPSERVTLTQKARWHDFRPEDVLFAQGEEDVPFSYLATGQLKLSSSAARGRECVLHVLRPNTVVDVGVLFFEGGLPYSVVAISQGSLCVFEKSVITGFMHTNVTFAEKLMRLMTARQRLFINKLVNSQGRISVSCRVSSWLLHRSRMEQTDELYFDMSRELMARLLGVTRESLSRELSRLAELGFIKVNRRCILLLEKAALQKLANG